MDSAARELWAAASALVAYLTTVLPRARRELRELGPLPPGKAANAEAVAVFAILAPRSHRAAVVRAIVALQVAIDLRDAAEEEGGANDPALAERTAELAVRWRSAVVTLPAWQVVQSMLEEAVKRCEQGQAQTHLAAREGSGQLRDWAAELDPTPTYRWWEIACGASSSAAAHALIAAAADSATTFVDAVRIDGAYQPSIGALTVFLDDLVDRDDDRAAGEHSYLAYYGGPGDVAERLTLLTSRAEMLIDPLPRADRHRAILAGVAGYYLSDPAADAPGASGVKERLLADLGPATRLLAGFARLRRLAWRK